MTVLIPAVLIGAISAATVHPGDSFRFRTTQAVTVGSVTVPAGTPGTGVIAAAQPGGHGVKTSTLDLEPRSLQLADGTTIAVEAAPASKATLDQTRHASGVPVPIFLPGVFLLGGLGHQARTVTLADGTPFTVEAQAP
jgi:hypothetical protein